MSKLQSARTFVTNNLDAILVVGVIAITTVGTVVLIKSSLDLYSTELRRAEDYRDFLRGFAEANPDAFTELTNAAIAITHK